MRNLIITAGILGAMTATTGAFAQDPAPATAPAPEPAPAPAPEPAPAASASGNVGVSLPGAAPAVATAGGSDHDQMAGRLAVGYFGITAVGAGAGLPAAGAAPAFNSSPYAFTGAAPVIGVRYWLDSMIGIDVGVGLGILGGSASVNAPPAPEIEADRDSFTAFTIHAGVPLSLASSQHFSWQVVPEVNFGIANVGQDPNGPDVEGDVSNSGLHLDIGARAGAEIHFGFIGIPQLSLQGSVGLGFALDKGSTTDSQGPAADRESSHSRTAFQTNAGTNPWAIFTNDIAAFYYF
jgi:hypothetical protein